MYEPDQRPGHHRVPGWNMEQSSRLYVQIETCPFVHERLKDFLCSEGRYTSKGLLALPATPGNLAENAWSGGPVLIVGGLLDLSSRPRLPCCLAFRSGRSTLGGYDALWLGFATADSPA